MRGVNMEDNMQKQGSGPRENGEYAEDHSDSGGEHKRAAEEFARTAAGQPEAMALPKVDFATFVMSLSSSAMMHMGEVGEPQTGEVDQNMPMAKQTIDILAMLEEKTTGNLSADENRLLRDVLFELRMKYVQKS